MSILFTTQKEQTDIIKSDIIHFSETTKFLLYSNEIYKEINSTTFLILRKTIIISFVFWSRGGNFRLPHFSHSHFVSFSVYYKIL